MRYLLDTHTVLWFLGDTENLSELAMKAILNPSSSKFVSIVSAWEVSIKLSTGKLKFEGGVEAFFHAIDENGFDLVSIERNHIQYVQMLPFHHRDPFDRLLLATAISENLEVITIDKNMCLYGVPCLW